MKLQRASLNATQILFLALVIVHLLPIWLFPYFPTQDGPSHVYNAQVLAEYSNPKYEFERYYQINWRPFPNWLSHALLAILLKLFPALIAEKLFLSFYVILFPLAILYFVNAVQPGRSLIALVVFPFIYNYLFLMGFYNFAVSVPLFFLALGYWWKNREQMTRDKIIRLNVLIVLIYFAHLISYVFILFSIGLMAILHFQKRMYKTLLTGCYLLPAGLLLIVYLPTSDLMAGGCPKLSLERTGELLRQFLSMRILVSYSETQAKIAALIVVLLGYLFIQTLWTYRPVADTRFSKRLTSQDSFFVLFVVLFGLYLILPNSVGPGGWVNDRLAILASMVLLGWFRVADRVWWRRGFAIAIAMISLINIAYISYTLKILNAELREFNSQTDHIERNKIVLPLFFEPNGKSLRVGIFVNAANYYCFDNGGINLGNYEVQFDYFPINFKPDFQTPTDEKEWVQTIHWRSEQIDLCAYAEHVDYLLLWGEPTEKVGPAIEACYQLMVTDGRLKLFSGNRQ